MSKIKSAIWKKRNKMRYRARRSAPVRKMLQDALLCGYCEKPFSEDYGMNKTVEHVIPLGMGGANTIENLKIVCSLCNVEKNREMNWEVAKKLYEDRWKTKGKMEVLWVSIKEFLKRCFGK